MTDAPENPEGSADPQPDIEGAQDPWSPEQNGQAADEQGALEDFSPASTFTLDVPAEPEADAEGELADRTDLPMVVMPSDQDLSPDRESAYECLEIRMPIHEFESFARARLETLLRLGERERADVAAAALKLGQGALRQVMGTVPKEAP